MSQLQIICHWHIAGTLHGILR